MQDTFIGIDIGGTFTDAVFFDGEKINILKTLTTPENPAKGVLKLLDRAKCKNFSLTHGSTLATNAVLERKGEKTAFITTKGFEDLLYIARQDRKELFNFDVQKANALVSEELCLGINERVDFEGKILKDISKEEIRELIRYLKEEEVKSLGVCLLFSYINNTHEDIIKKEAKGIINFVSISSLVIPEYREYERASTTVLNAYVSPILKKYINGLDKELSKRGAIDFKIMESGGGIIPAIEAAKLGVRTILSGPAGGVAGAFELAKRAGINKIITLDMGGTSTDVSLCDNEILRTKEGEIDGFPIGVPMVDIVTIGAGGGSIAHVDEGGILKVGPQSAGSNPGPAAFGKGDKATVTDAHLVLKTLDETDFLGGQFGVSRDRALNAVGKIAKKLNISIDDAAMGIVRIAISHMERALRVVSLQRGYDPSFFTLVPFGGAGSLHASYLADFLGIKKIMIPKYPGVLSALGMILCDFRIDFSKSILKSVQEITEDIYKLFVKELFIKAECFLNKNYFERAFIETIFDMRYKGQSFEIPIVSEKIECHYGEDIIQLPKIPDFNKDMLLKSFHEEHFKKYGFFRQEEDVEIVNVRIELTGKSTKIDLPKINIKENDIVPKESGYRNILFPSGERLNTPFYKRESLVPGNVIEFPAVIVQYDTTILVPDFWKAEVDIYENIILTKKGDK